MIFALNVRLARLVQSLYWKVGSKRCRNAATSLPLLQPSHPGRSKMISSCCCVASGVRWILGRANANAKPQPTRLGKLYTRINRTLRQQISTQSVTWNELRGPLPMLTNRFFGAGSARRNASSHLPSAGQFEIKWGPVSTRIRAMNVVHSVVLGLCRVALNSDVAQRCVPVAVGGATPCADATSLSVLARTLLPGLDATSLLSAVTNITIPRMSLGLSEMHRPR